MLNSVVSSAYIIGVNIFVADTISFMCMMKSNGPRIEPCGTPVVLFDMKCVVFDAVEI